MWTNPGFSRHGGKKQKKKKRLWGKISKVLTLPDLDFSFSFVSSIIFHFWPLCEGLYMYI